MKQLIVLKQRLIEVNNELTGAQNHLTRLRREQTESQAQLANLAGDSDSQLPDLAALQVMTTARNTMMRTLDDKCWRLTEERHRLTEAIPNEQIRLNNLYKAIAQMETLLSPEGAWANDERDATVAYENKMRILADRRRQKQSELAQMRASLN